MTIDGTISADGGDNGYGGGAGGSIWILADTLTGTGAITADGGSAGGDSRVGGGGGGRISLQWNSGNMDFTGVIRAKGGLKSGGSALNHGSHGTIYVHVPDDPDNAWKEFWNASRHVKYDIALPPGEYTFDDLYVDSGVTLECQGDDDGTPAEGTGVVINAANVTVEGNAAISAYGLGFCEGQGPGTGTSYGKGGSHGGVAGGSSGFGDIYGSVSEPLSLGSGGASEGIAGGAIKLDISGMLTLNGSLSASGEDHPYGAGAGGSIWIETNVLTGSGSVVANAGNATHGTEDRVSGAGGGRIAIYASSNIAGLSPVTVSEGSGLAGNGEPGTLVWAPIGGYTEENVIPADQCVETGGVVTITFKIKDPGDEINGTLYNANHTLKSFEFSINGGPWTEPTNGDASGCLSGGWPDNSGSNYTAAADFAGAPAYGFTWNTLHADVSGHFPPSPTVRIRFEIKDTVTQGMDTYYLDSVSFVTSEGFTVSNP